MSCNCKNVDCTKCIYCLNIKILRSDAGSIIISFFEDDDIPIELTEGYLLKSTKSIEENILLTWEDNNMTLSYTTEQANKMRNGSFPYRIIRINEFGQEKTLINGKIIVIS